MFFGCHNVCAEEKILHCITSALFTSSVPSDVNFITKTLISEIGYTLFECVPVTV